MNTTHDHLVSFDEDGLCVRVYRVMPEQERVFYMEMTLPQDPGEGWRLSEAARILGEEILRDSPYAHYLFTV